MSEARIRSLAQSQSNIFSASPAPRSRPREVPQTQSKIFTPLPQRPKPMTYSREKYNRTTISLGTDYETDNPVHKPDYSNSSPAGRRTNQSSSTKYLLGNDRGSFYKKSVDENFGVPSNFEPNYSKESAFERKQKEFNNGHSPKKEANEEKVQIFNAEFNPKQRRIQDRVSVFDSASYSVPEPVVRGQKPPLYDPSMRKSEILSSDVFNERQLAEYRRPVEPPENFEDRHRNHLYSDLFGQASSPSRNRVVEKEERRNVEYDPRMQAQRVLSSQIDIGDSPKRQNRARTPQVQEKPRQTEGLTSSQRKQEELSTSYSKNKPQASKPELVDLELSSVPRNLAAADIKDLCGGVHVVSLALDIDNFTGNCKGTGRVKLRTNETMDVGRLERIFGAKGIKVEKLQENLGRKNNYQDICGVNWSTPYDYKRGNTPLGARETKMKNLESSVFGEGAKWEERGVESFDGELSAQILWKNTKNPRINY